MKYQIVDMPYRKIDSLHEIEIGLYKDQQLIAIFQGDGFNNKTNAQKVCDLLNEVSRSQGKHG